MTLVAYIYPLLHFFLSYGNTYSKWFNHKVGKSYGKPNITNIKVFYDISIVAHMSITACIKVKDANVPEIENGDHVKSKESNHHKFINWNKVTEANIHEIETYVFNRVNYIHETGVANCPISGCRHQAHLQHL